MQHETILDSRQLRPVLLGRASIHALGFAIGLSMVLVGDVSAWLPAISAVVTAVAFYQIRHYEIHRAWMIDMVMMVALSYLSESPVGLVVVLGWGAALGLAGAPRRWQVPVAVGVASGAAMIAWEIGKDRTVVESGFAVLAVVLVTVVFASVFQAVGRRLRHNEMELREFFDRVPVALVRTNPQGELLQYNRATADMFRDPAIGERVVGRYVDPEQRRTFIEKLMAEGTVRDHEVLFQVGPNSTIDAVIAANSILDDGGELRFIESVIFDVSSLRSSERERETLARVVDSATDLIAIGNWDGSVRYANAAAQKWMQQYITDDEYVHLAQGIGREDFVSIRESIRDSRAWSGVIEVAGKTGVRVINTSAQALEFGTDYTVATISRDVTDEVETERKLKGLVRAKDELVASISHEIRTPLSVVLGLASELRDRYVDFDPHMHQEFASLITDQGQEMANIVEDLLVAARADTGSIVLSPGVVDLHGEVEATARSLPEYELRGTLSNRADAQCWGDPGRIRQILRNLITNARRYGGDDIVIATRRFDDHIELDVVDDGSGVSEDEAGTIFEPFGRAHSAGTQPGSIGLGLSVSRDLARRMGGDLVYSRVAEQTVFTLTLPRLSPSIRY